MIVIDKNWCGLCVKNEYGGGYYYELYCDLVATENVTVDLDSALVIFGDISVDGSFISKQHSLLCHGGITVMKNIEIKGTIEADSDVIAGGNIKAVAIKVGGYVSAGKNIDVGEGIVANSHIDANGDVVAGASIQSGYIKAQSLKSGWGIRSEYDIAVETYIDAGGPIFAGVSVNGTEKTSRNTIHCTELRRGEIAHGKLFKKESPSV